MRKIVEYGKQYPYAFPLRFGPFACFLTIHHPDYVKTILGSTGGWTLFSHSPAGGRKKIDQNHNRYLFFFPTEPKDDLTVSFIEPWIGETNSVGAACSVLVNCWGVCVQPQILLCCLQGMACSFQMVPGGSSTGGSWPRASTMMFWNHTWDWCPILLKICWWVKWEGRIAESPLKLLQIDQDMWYKFFCHEQDKWECHANTDKPFELFEQISLMTLDTIMKCAFSHKSNCQAERWDLLPFSDDVYSVTKSSVKMNWDGWMDACRPLRSGLGDRVVGR